MLSSRQPPRLTRSLDNQRGLTLGALLLLFVAIGLTGWWILHIPHAPKQPVVPAAHPQLPALSASVGQVAPPESSAQAPASPLSAPAATRSPLDIPPASSPARPASSPLFDELQAIHALIHDGRAADAEARLRSLTESLRTETDRAAGAALWNNLGALQHKQDGPVAAIPAYQQALALSPEFQAASVNLTYAYWQSTNPALTREMLERAVAAEPGKAWTHLALADYLFTKHDDLAGARSHVNQAMQVDGAAIESQPLLKALAEKLARAEQAEHHYVSRESSHFVVKFNGTEDYEVWTRVLTILEDAYRDIGQRFSYFPPRPIIVVLHTKAAFQTATGSPAWADGLFDPMLGRIQVPTQNALTDQAWLTRVLRHEYVHALLHQRVEGRLGAVPTWLNEGLAMHLAGDPWPDLDQIARGEITLIPLQQLEGGWGGFSHAMAGRAYLEGHSAVKYLIERFGMGRIQDLLSDLAQRRSFADAVTHHLSTSYEELQRQWINELNARLQAGHR